MKINKKKRDIKGEIINYINVILVYFGIGLLIFILSLCVGGCGGGKNPGRQPANSEIQMDDMGGAGKKKRSCVCVCCIMNAPVVKNQKNDKKKGKFHLLVSRPENQNSGS